GSSDRGRARRCRVARGADEGIQILLWSDDATDARATPDPARPEAYPLPGSQAATRPPLPGSRYVGAMTASGGADPAVLRVAREASATVGDTPMVEMQRLGRDVGGELIAKP